MRLSLSAGVEVGEVAGDGLRWQAARTPPVTAAAARHLILDPLLIAAADSPSVLSVLSTSHEESLAIFSFLS